MLRKWWLLVATQNTQAFFAHCIAFYPPECATTVLKGFGCAG
jgi:hypothetical protein